MEKTINLNVRLATKDNEALKYVEITNRWGQSFEVIAKKKKKTSIIKT